MALNLFELAKQYLDSNIVSKAASFLGESETSVRKGIDAALPTSMLGMSQQVDKGHSDAIFGMAQEASNSGILNNFGSNFASSGGVAPAASTGWLNNIFGSNLSGVTSALSNYAGLKGGSISTLLGTIVPLVLGLLGKQAKENNLTAAGLPALFGSLKNTIMSALPAGLNIPGLTPVSETVHQATARNRAAAAQQVAKKKPSWLSWLLISLLGLALLVYLLRGCGRSETEEIVIPPDTVAAETTQAATPARVSVIKVRLPNGEELDANEGGIEDNLVKYLNSNDPVDQNKWFDFRDLNFKFGTAEIMPESRGEVTNIIKIMRAYPKAKIKIGGYTDRVGDEAANKKLSQDRADAVTQALKDGGVGAQVESAEGYGSQFAQYAADAPEEERKKDRRVAVSVRAK